MMRMLIPIMLLLLVAPSLAWSQVSGAALFHNQMVSIWSDKPGWNIDFGEFDSGLADCDWSQGYPPQCQANGYVHIDWSGPIPQDEFGEPSEYGMTAVHWYEGPAYDVDGIPIPDTEDVRFTVTDNLGPKYLGGSIDVAWIILRRTITGEGLHFQGGGPFPAGGLIIDYGYGADKELGRGPLMFEPGNVGAFQGASLPAELMFDDFLDWHIDSQAENVSSDLVPVPVPEPGLSLGLVIGCGALGSAVRARRSGVPPV